MDQRPEQVEPFRLLFVCTGNVCRSVLAERHARGELQRRLGPQANAVVVSSSGTGSLVGDPMDSAAADALVRLGGDPADHVARDLDADQVREADLILTATRAHRGAVARLEPRATRRTFTIREFDRLVAGVQPVDLPAEGNAGTRMRALVEEAAARRGLIPAVRADEDDLPDPYRGPAELHERTARTTAAALARPLDLLVFAITGETLARPHGDPGDFPTSATTPLPWMSRLRRRRAT